MIAKERRQRRATQSEGQPTAQRAIQSRQRTSPTHRPIPNTRRVGPKIGTDEARHFPIRRPRFVGQPVREVLERCTRAVRLHTASGLPKASRMAYLRRHTRL